MESKNRDLTRTENIVGSIFILCAFACMAFSLILGETKAENFIGAVGIFAFIFFAGSIIINRNNENNNQG